MKYTCPYCNKAFSVKKSDEDAKKYLPFCCRECKLADLGDWFDGHYRISQPLEEVEDLSDIDFEEPESEG